MRSGWIAAGLAVLCCAAPAEAARYLEFKLIGTTIQPFADQMGNSSLYEVRSTVTV